MIFIVLCILEISGLKEMEVYLDDRNDVFLLHH